MSYVKKNLGVFLAGILIATIGWSLFELLLPVGIVNGHIIYKYELNSRLNQAAGNAVKNICKDYIFDKSMRELGLHVTDNEVEKELNIMIEKYGGVKEFERILLDTQGDKESVKQSIRKGLYKQKAVEHFAKQVDVSEKTIEEYWNAQKNKYPDFHNQYSQLEKDFKTEKGTQAYETYMQAQEQKGSIKIY